MDDSSNTTPKQPGGVTGKGFVKGDPRINRNGRPKSFDALQKLTIELAHEVATTKDGAPVVRADHRVTVVEAVLRQWLQSGNFQKQQAALQIAFGKVPDVTRHEGADGGPIEFIVKYANGRNNPTDTA